MQKDILKKTIFLIIFILLGFLAMQVPFSQLVGAKNVRFSLFDFYGPIAGGFVGGAPGLVIVALMQLANWAFHGFNLDLGIIIRFFPMLFAVLYFAKRSKWILLVPLVSMIAFWAHPEGRGAWYFALYWTIPIFCYFLYDKFLFARALGSTFTAHSVGGALWVWAFNMKAGAWIGLIPVVWKERLLMALGIMLTYIIFNWILSALDKKFHLQLSFLTLDATHLSFPRKRESSQ